MFNIYRYNFIIKNGTSLNIGLEKCALKRIIFRRDNKRKRTQYFDKRLIHFKRDDLSIPSRNSHRGACGVIVARRISLINC